MAKNAYLNHKQEASKQVKHQGRLNSGYRINSSADDAAGLSISEKMHAQIRGLARASENAQNAVCLTQVADFALGETTNMLVRMRALAIQAANDTNSDSDRDKLNEEFQQLKTEIDRIAWTTEYNGKKLLWGNSGEEGMTIPAREVPAFAGSGYHPAVPAYAGDGYQPAIPAHSVTVAVPDAPGEGWHPPVTTGGAWYVGDTKTEGTLGLPPDYTLGNFIDGFTMPSGTLDWSDSTWKIQVRDDLNALGYSAEFFDGTYLGELNVNKRVYFFGPNTIFPDTVNVGEKDYTKPRAEVYMVLGVGSDITVKDQGHALIIEEGATVINNGTITNYDLDGTGNDFVIGRGGTFINNSGGKVLGSTDPFTGGGNSTAALGNLPLNGQDIMERVKIDGGNFINLGEIKGLYFELINNGTFEDYAANLKEYFMFSGWDGGLAKYKDYTGIKYDVEITPDGVGLTTGVAVMNLYKVGSLQWPLVDSGSQNIYKGSGVGVDMSGQPLNDRTEKDYTINGTYSIDPVTGKLMVTFETSEFAEALTNGGSTMFDPPELPNAVFETIGTKINYYFDETGGGTVTTPGWWDKDPVPAHEESKWVDEVAESWTNPPTPAKAEYWDDPPRPAYTIPAQVVEPRKGLYFQVGANSWQAIQMNLYAMNTYRLGSYDQSGQLIMNLFGTNISSNGIGGKAENGKDIAPKLENMQRVTEFDSNGNQIWPDEDTMTVLKVIDDSINMVTSLRSKFGAMSNRIEHTAKSLDISGEQLSDADSRIRDANMAREMLEYTQSRIRDDAGGMIMVHVKNTNASFVNQLLNG